ncbi:histidine kinase [Streptomyces sp. NPDC048290]|uniref:sensor histidine kinase n=1 Tax=Streptomyces sp. NPDC048290 TaxID=3155811 RepID=UPI00342B7CE0
MHRLIATPARLRRAHPWLTDVVLFVLVAFPPVIRTEPGWRPVWVQAILYGALVLPLLWRRHHPVLVAAVVTAAFWAQYLGHVWGQEPGRGAVAVAAVLATLTVRGLRRAATATAVSTAVCVVLWFPLWQREYGGTSPGDAWLTSLAVVLLLAGAWVFGEWVRARRAYIAEFERRAELAESQRLALARVAVAEERARIAREIHDVLAHSVSVMVLNAEGGRLIRRSDPEAADRALGVIGATGREALGELRRLLEVLHTPGESGGDAGDRRKGTTGDAGDGRIGTAGDDEDVHETGDGRKGTAGDHGDDGDRREGTAGATDDPQDARHLVADLRRLVDRLNTTVPRARLDIRGTPRGLPSDLTLQTYRIVQEALTNAVKHGPPDAAIRVRVDTGAQGPGRLVRVRVENSGGGPAWTGRPVPASSPGRGLAGMRVRTARYGGSVDAGPTPDGGYRVDAVLRPAGAEPATVVP